MDNLLKKIKERASNPKTIHDMAEGLSPEPQINKLVDISKIQEIEKELGFKFPELLVRIYTEIGDGGFGPGYGLYEIEHARQLYLEWIEDPDNEWEKGTFPLCTWGCGIDSYVDCCDKDFTIYYGNECVDDDSGDITFTISDENGSIVQEGKGGSITEILDGLDNENPIATLDTSNLNIEVDESIDEEDVGLLFHKNTLEEWLTDWVNGVDLWTEMMGEDDEEDD